MDEKSARGAFLLGVLVNLAEYAVDPVCGGLGGHGLVERAAIVIQPFHALDQALGRHVLLLQHVAEALGPEGLGVEQLVAPAGTLGIGDQQRGLAGG